MNKTRTNNSRHKNNNMNNHLDTTIPELNPTPNHVTKQVAVSTEIELGGVILFYLSIVMGFMLFIPFYQYRQQR